MNRRIFVNGTFDVLHPGHIELLNYARGLGDHLMVAIDSDRRVRELKGTGRPVHSEYERTTMLANLRSVDAVRVFDTDQDLIDIIAVYRPYIMVKGSDSRGQPIVGEELCAQIEFFERINEYSTTKTIQRIANR
jgi:D-beta-D-heptose 7-phosphate kinase/D-beta-D-heptose 1-phosphate adenosyltransferase